MPSSHTSLDGSVVDVVAPGSVDDDVVLVVATAPVVDVVGRSVVVGVSVVVGAAVVVGASVLDVVVVGSSVVVGASVVDVDDVVGSSVEVVVGSSVVVGASVVDVDVVVGSSVEVVVGASVEVVGCSVVDVVVSVVDVVVSGGTPARARPAGTRSAMAKAVTASGETRDIEPMNPRGRYRKRQPVRTSQARSLTPLGAPFAARAASA